MKREDVFMAKRGLGGVFFNVAEAGEVIENFAFGSSAGGQEFAALLEGADLFEREGVTLNGGGGVNVAGARVLLKCGDPGELNGGALYALAECGDAFHDRQKRGADGKLRHVGHGVSKA